MPSFGIWPLVSNRGLLSAQVVLGRTEGGAVFGAYNNRGWIGER